MRRASTVLLALLAGVSLCGLSAKRVFIEAISGYDSETVNLAPTYLTQWLHGLGHVTVTSPAEADYFVRFAVVTAKAERSFNWWILLFPLWPIIPFTTVEADVVLFIEVRTTEGRTIFTNQAGGESSSFWFADFVTRSNRKRAAFDQAFKALTVTARIP